MPQMSADYLGLLTLTGAVIRPSGCRLQGCWAVTPDLRSLYASSDRPVVFIDESYQLDGSDRYYIVAAAMVDTDLLVSTRRALRAFYGSDVMHASAMYQRAEFASIAAATRLVSQQMDASDVVIYTPVDESDLYAASARERCLQHIVTTLHRDFEASTFVIDARPLPAENEADRRVIRDLRRSGLVGRDVTAVHARPSQEPLITLADIMAWAFRQEHARHDRSWFEPLREHTQVTRLP